MLEDINFLFSFFFTWVLGLLIPVTLRFWILKRPLSKLVSISVVSIVFLLQFLGSEILESKNKTQTALALVAYVGYMILRKNSGTAKYCRECGAEINSSTTSCPKCGIEIVFRGKVENKGRWGSLDIILIIIAILLAIFLLVPFILY